VHLKPRFIPVLLLRHSGPVKTERFGDARYIGDAINAVSIFSEKMVDEIVVIDIDATAKRRHPNVDLVRDIATEAFMPFAYGGGVTTVDQIERLLRAGAEKVAINAAFHANPQLISEAARRFGSQAVQVSLDVRRTKGGKLHVVSHNGARTVKGSPAEFARRAADLGAGEILLQSVDRDGVGHGYDLALVREVTSAVSIPVIALGGAGSTDDLASAIVQGGAAAAAAGSMFVFYGRLRGVLINVPTPAEMTAALERAHRGISPT